MPAIADLLKQLRTAAGITQEELAERAAVSVRTVSDIERGLRSTIYRDTSGRLADALGLSGTERDVFETAARGRDAGGALVSALPSPGGRFIGRERELESLADALTDPSHRLVTLTGPGGIGKTRLAIEAARASAHLFDTGIWFIALAGNRDSSLVLPMIARATGAGPAGGALFDAIASRLAGARSLIVLDTFEHLLPAATTVAELAVACPSLTMLVTSREALHVRAEKEIAIPPLEVTSSGGGSSPAEELFMERANAVGVDAGNAGSRYVLAQICERLNGLPLAIELAAARTKHLSIGQLLEQLDHRLRVLTGGPRDLPVRQQTMRDTVAWSYDLLDTDRQRLLRALSIFDGGWTLESAEAVFGEPRVLDGISALVDKSVVTMARDAEPARYGMLDVIREFAADERDAAGETMSLEDRHAAYFLALAERAEPELGGAGQQLWFDLLDDEAQNLRGAMRTLVSRIDSERAVRLAAALWMFWRLRGDIAEGRTWLTRALALTPAVPGPARAKALWGAAWLAYQQEDLEAAARLGDQILSAWDDDIARRNALTIRSIVAIARDQASDAIPWLRECVDILRRIEPGWLLATSLMNLAVAELAVREHDAPSTHVAESLDLYRSIGDDRFAARAIKIQGLIALHRGDVASATALCRETLHAFHELGDAWGVAEGLESLAAVASASGRPARAARLIGAAQALRAPSGSRPWAFEAKLMDRFTDAARDDLGKDAWDRAVEEGRALGLDEAVTMAMDDEPEES